jgi:hypothetical protein
VEGPSDLERSRLLFGWLQARRAVDRCLSDLLAAGPAGERRVREQLELVDDLENRAREAFVRYRRIAWEANDAERPEPDEAGQGGARLAGISLAGSPLAGPSPVDESDAAPAGRAPRLGVVPPPSNAVQPIGPIGPVRRVGAGAPSSAPAQPAGPAGSVGPAPATPTGPVARPSGVPRTAAPGGEPRRPAVSRSGGTASERPSEREINRDAGRTTTHPPSLDKSNQQTPGNQHRRR